MDDKLKWLETRLSSSLRPRNEDLKNMFANDENRLAFHEFINNEDVRRLFVYIRPPRQIIASLQPAHDLKTKSVFFLKNNVGVKLTKDNMDDEVMYMDCSDNALAQLDLLTREVYLPLLCADTNHASSYGLSADKLMDLLHRLMSQVETIQGHTEGEIILPLPSIEVLAEAAVNVNRRGAVLHVLETTVIGWIKQIKGLLRHNPIADLERQSGEFPGPLDEVQLWQTRLEKLNSINIQLDSPVAQDILRNLEDANSTYATSFHNVRKDINKAISDTEEILKFLSTMMNWFHQLHDCLDPHEMLKLFPPLIHVLLLVWRHSKYYHQVDRFHNLLRLISNEVVHRAEAMVGEDVLREPLESYSKLKEALRVCAAFRGTYLDYRDKAEEINEKNKQEHADKMHHRPQGQQLFSTKMYGPKAYKPSYGLGKKEDDEEELNEEELTKDSPWPPRNAPAFDLLNAFMERCNDVLELVQTTRHFRLLADAADVGGAGSVSLDALVKEIHTKYAAAMDMFFSKVSNVLAIDGTQAFEKAFFTFRTIVKDLEKKISEVLRQSFAQCPTIGAQLRLLEVFEGISGRELVQIHLRDKDNQLVSSFTKELIQVRGLFQQSVRQPPMHANMPLVVSKLMWIWGLKERINGPMQKMKKVSPHSLEGDLGWQLRDAYHEAMSDLDRYENKTLNEWQLHITAELTDRLKQPLLVAEDYDEDEDIRPQTVHVNLDPELLLLLKEIHYLSQEPFSIKLPGPARELLRNTNSKELRVTATRLETIVSKYNTVMKSMTEYEQPLFERSLAKIDHLFEQGLHTYTWRTEESADFIETANALVCVDIHTNLDIVQTNCHEIAQITISWSDGTLDVFTSRLHHKSYNIEELVETQIKLNEDFESAVIPSGNKIHGLLRSSFEAVQISEASPAWQDYLDYIDAIVLDGLKKSSLVSLKAMLNQIVKSNMNEENTIPILMIRLELMENMVAFRPPLDQNTSDSSVQETVDTWLAGYLARGRLVSMLGGKGSYQDYIQMDEEVQQLVEHINKLVKDNGEECKNLFELFKDYSFLWEQDVNQTFEEFLQGHVSPNPLRASAKPSEDPRHKLLTSAGLTSRGSSAKSSVDTYQQSNAVDRTFLTPKKDGKDADSNVPSLDEFDSEIDIYRTARDDVYSLQDFQDVGWLRVDLRPIKQVLITYASKWMWTFTKYLSDQVTNMLENLDAFLKRIEPEIESITGEERDTASFMKMMRLFNEVSAQQQEMDGKFSAMQKTVLLVKKYGQKLPQHTQALFDAAPGRWNNLKTKVSLAKQRLGPRIQEESESISKDLAKFGERVIAIHSELENSEVYNRDCSIADSWIIIDGFVKRLSILESEAQDLIELQELLETNVVNFDLLPQCRHDLSNLKQVWETFRLIDSQQTEWKRHRWQKMNTKFLKDETNKQLETVRNLPEDVFTWDVYMGLHESITGIQVK